MGGVILILLNENTSHIIDISEMGQSPVGTVREDIDSSNLAQSHPYSRVLDVESYTSLAFAVILVELLETFHSQGRMEFVGYKAPLQLTARL